MESTTNTTHLPGHLRSEFPVTENLAVQVRNTERPRRFHILVTDGNDHLVLASRTKVEIARGEARSLARRLAEEGGPRA